jgi:hypothetical protein
MRVLLSIFLLSLVATPALAAPQVKAVHGNIIVIDGKGPARTLTTTGHDSDPVLSPDGKRVVFVRSVAGPAPKDCSADLSEAKPVELWTVGSNGSGAKKLLGLHSAKDVHAVVCAFGKPQFSSNSQLLYFETPAWATSGAVHVYDFKASADHFVSDGDDLTVLNSCLSDQYRDALMMTKHKYFAFGGSYDWYWLVSPAGKELGPIGETTNAAKDECS